MKKLLAPVAGALLVISSPTGATTKPVITPVPPPKAVTPLDPASLALAQQILSIAYPPEKRAQMYASIMDSIIDQTRKNMLSQMTTDDKDFDTVLDRSLQRMYDQMKATVNASIPDYFESFARAYARAFSPDDLRAILAFAKTPEGQDFFERSPLILKDPDVQAATQRMQAQLAAKLPEMQRQMLQDVDDYVAKKAKGEKTASTPVS